MSDLVGNPEDWLSRDAAQAISAIMASVEDANEMSRLVGKPTMWFPNRSDTNRPVQTQKRARSLKFWI